MKICVSACLLGECCKYNAEHNLVTGLRACLSGHEIIDVCPEVLGGLPTPRAAAEICAGRVRTCAGEDVTEAFRRGAAIAAKAAEGCEMAILQPRSPSCGVTQIYDGSFTGTLITGTGLFARLLIEAGVPCYEADHIPHEIL